MDVKKQFDDFLKNIRLTPDHVDDLKTGHSTLRKRLRADSTLSPLLVADFLQGSYRRHTAVKPKDGKRADVDIVVVTNLDEVKYTPQQAMNIFKPFLERYYQGKWQFQGRSIGIEMSYVDLDIVVTSAPSEIAKRAVSSKSIQDDFLLEDIYEYFTATKANAFSDPAWKTSPLRIPDREAKCWDDTHPLMQIVQTSAKNKETSGLYINVVKALKWWRRIHSEPKYPKGYPLEHLVYLACPDSIDSLAEGVTLSLENIATQYQSDVDAGQTPVIADHGVPTHNVLKRVSAEDFKDFHTLICSAAETAREALEAPTIKESCDKWRLLFGEEFPEPPDQGDVKKGSFEAPQEASSPSTGRFA